MQVPNASGPVAQTTELPPNRLRELRRKRGWETYDISARFRVVPSTVSRWETGKTQMPDHVRLALAAEYGVTVAYLMGWDDDENGGDDERQAAA